MNHCTADVRKHLHALPQAADQNDAVVAAHEQLGEHILAYAKAWDDSDLPMLAEQLPEIIWHAICVSEMLDLPTHNLWLDIRNKYIAGVAPDIKRTLTSHFDNRVTL